MPVDDVVKKNEFKQVNMYLQNYKRAIVKTWPMVATPAEIEKGITPQYHAPGTMLYGIVLYCIVLYCIAWYGISYLKW